MKKIINYIEKYFWAILILGIFIGVILPEPFSQCKPALPYLLGMVLFLSFLKIDHQELIKNFKKPSLIIWIVFAQMIVVPIVLFSIFRIWDFNLALAILITAAIPAAVASPALADIFKGNISLAIIITVIEHLIAPITLPFLIYILAGQNIDLSILEMFVYIAKVVFIPFVLSVIIKRSLPNIINKTKQYFQSFTILLITLVVIVAIAITVPHLTENAGQIILNVIIFLGLGIAFHFLGYLICTKQQKQNSITCMVTLAYNNAALALLIAIKFFDPKIIFYCVCYEIVWNLLPFFSKNIFSFVFPAKKKD